MKKIKLSPEFIGFLQTLGFLAYTAIVGAIMLNGNSWFGPMNKTPLLGPILFLSLFVFSAIATASILLAYPFYIFWEKKDLKTAFKIVASSALFLLVFIIAVIASLTLLH